MHDSDLCYRILSGSISTIISLPWTAPGIALPQPTTERGTRPRARVPSADYNAVGEQKGILDVKVG